MNKGILTVFFTLCVFIASTAISRACDFCLLSQGISPLETQSGSGVRVNERYTLVDKAYEGTGGFTISPSAKEEFWTTELTGFYGVTENLTVLGVVPFRKTTLDGHMLVHEDGETEAHPDMKGEETGLGDVAAIGRYTFFKKHTLDSTTALAALAGIKFATGKTDGKTNDGSEFLDAHLQLGTGSTDFLLGLSASRAMQRLSLSANMLASITTRGRAGDKSHRFGNALNYDLTAKHRVYPGGAATAGGQLFFALGANGEARGREKEDGVVLKNSGGHTVYASVGAQLVMDKKWVIELLYHKAVYHNLNGKQLGENYKANCAVTHLF
ncbi:MAG: hypothetical protein HY884_00765 [Deltaproteobacteria bacterium]|nr:hypothetical protein [Deltaproteobacteria bacterium]